MKQKKFRLDFCRPSSILLIVELFVASGIGAMILLCATLIVNLASHNTYSTSTPLHFASVLPQSIFSASQPQPGIAATPTAEQGQQLVAEAQNDMTIATLIIAWSGFFLAFLATATAVAGFFGIREIRHLQELRKKFGMQIQEIAGLKNQIETELGQLVKRFENESQTLMEASYEFGVATDAYKIGDNNRAVEYYLRVLQLQQRSTLVMERLGRTYNNLNDFKQAKDFLEKALAIDPSYAPALRTMALCYRYSDTDKALEYLERCFEVNPSDYEALDFLGLIYRDKELYDEAIYYHERALSIRKRPETEFYLSILYAFKGDKRRSKLMALNAEDDLRKEEHEDRLRLAWKLIIRGAAQIIDGNENTALQIIQEAIPYLTTQRIYDEFTTHLKLLLISTNHKAWIPKFMKDLKVKDM